MITFRCAVSFTFLALFPSKTRLTYAEVFLVCKSIQTGRVMSTRTTGTGILKAEKELMQSRQLIIVEAICKPCIYTLLISFALSVLSLNVLLNDLT